MAKTGGSDMGKVKHHSASKVPEKRRAATGKGEPEFKRVDAAKAVGEVSQPEIENQNYVDGLDDQGLAHFIRENGI